LAWQALNLFCALNGRARLVSADDAVEAMLRVAAGELDGAAVADWLATRLGPAER
jgi:prophage maintenance system killer protein